MASVPCSLGCGNPVNPHDTGTWKKVTGYVGGPKKDSMRLREDTGEFAHDHCVAKLIEGQAIDQPSMFDGVMPTLKTNLTEPLPPIFEE